MNSFFRINEYKILGLRILLVFVFYFIARLLFFIYNFDLLNVDSVAEFFEIAFHGLVFDTAAIFYVNALFIVLSILPFFINKTKTYQKVLFYIYFLFNLLAYATNFVDFIYYKFIFSRSTSAVVNTLEHESNLSTMFFRFLISYWHVFLLYILTSILWVYLYKKINLNASVYSQNKLKYVLSSIIGLLFIAGIMIGGIRGGSFSKSSRPVNLVDANRYVTKPEQADLVLNSPFAIIRTINTNTFKKVKYDLPANEVEKYFIPIKNYNNNIASKPNIVVIITESMGREYCGAFNTQSGIKDYISYTPFLDSLANQSLIFSNAYANGSKSIHGMSSVLSGIPSFKDAYTSSPYAKQKIQSLVSVLNDLGYDTSFFHGAENGSMGFLGFGNILGIKNYYGRTEYNNDEDFDGNWGIWDEPFMQFMNKELSKKKQPFFATLFTVSSHEPFNIPEKYEGKFPKGDIPMHKCVGYTDYAFKKFFEAAKKEAWYQNTIFVITADHANQVFYGDEYYKVANRSAVPILFYKPDGSLQGNSFDLAQQIDIYPTVLDLIGYDKPFRSWGRSLIGDKKVKPFVINFNGSTYQLQRGNLITIFDGEKVTGFYDKNDKGLTKNLIGNKTKEMIENEIAVKAFMKDYFDRIVDRKL